MRTTSIVPARRGSVPSDGVKRRSLLPRPHVLLIFTSQLSVKRKISLEIETIQVTKLENKR